MVLREEHMNRMLRRIFGPKRNGLTGGWKGLHNEQHQNVNCSPRIIIVIKSKRIKREGHVARMG
jgi:hypothetical protein